MHGFVPGLADAVITTGILQGIDPSVVIDAPGTTKGVVSFLLTILFGGFVIYRTGGKLDAAVDASMSNPVVSVIYGVMAFGIVSVLVAFAFNELARLNLGATTLFLLGGTVLGTVLLSLGGIGFVVVGAWLADMSGFGDPWIGLVGLGAVSAVAWALFPVGLALLVWIGIAAVGLGGPARVWVHQGTVVVERE